MKLAHLAIVTPHATGLYESAREIVVAENKLGHNAFILDPTVRRSDRGAPIGNGALDHTDVVVSHSGLNYYDGCGKPVIYCLHGRPESSFLLEMRPETRKKHPVYSMVAKAATDAQYKRFITFWPETVSYWELLLGKGRVDVVPAPVDLEEWTPDGPSGYQFGGKRGAINVVITDLWREDKTPYHAIHGFVRFAEDHPEARLHVYGIRSDNQPLKVLLAAMERRGMLGEVKGMVRGLANVYRAADVLISPQRLATRAIREAMACGCNVVHVGTSDLGGLRVVDPEDLEEWGRVIGTATEVSRDGSRAMAEKLYDSKLTAEAMLKLCEEVANA